MHVPARCTKNLHGRRAVASALLLVVAAATCSPSAKARAASARAKQRASVVREITATLNGIRSRYPTIPGIALYVRATDAGFEWSGAVGKLATGESASMRANAAFRIASVTKTFVATSVFLLSQQRRLALDTPIDTLVNPSSADILRSDGYDLHAITVRHL